MQPLEMIAQSPHQKMARRGDRLMKNKILLHNDRNIRNEQREKIDDNLFGQRPGFECVDEEKFHRQVFRLVLHQILLM